MVRRPDNTTKLRQLLFKLGIKSAEVNWLEEALMSMHSNFGAPEQLIMSHQAYQDFMKFFGKKDESIQESESDRE